MDQKSSFSYKNTNPIQQGIFCIVLVTIISIICLVCRIKSIQSWNMILSPIFLFCFYNPIIGVFKQKMFQYAAISTIVLVILAFFIYLAGSFVSELSYAKVEELHKITALVFLFYFLLYTISIVFRAVLYLLNEVDK